MKIYAKNNCLILCLLLSFLCISENIHADVITDWNINARNIVVKAKLNTPFANRALAIVHTAVYESVNAITKFYPATDFTATKVDTTDASIEAAVAAANRITLLSLIPNQEKLIEKIYQESLSKISDASNIDKGIKIGTMAAKHILDLRNNDNSDVIDSYRPYSTAGKYVPTNIPAVPYWGNRKPWLLNTSSQFRPGAPPALNSKTWARDFNEVKLMGNKDSAQRNKEQTAMAKFWEATLPPIYHGVVHSVANMPNRNVTQNARLFATITRATDDALISVFDAKYHYGFWRPITAIRNADLDANNKTETEASWTPFIPTPMHPEYPCAHCVVAGTVGEILKAEIAENTSDDDTPLLTTTSVTANNAMRSWSSIDDFVQEVSDARIYDGVHYRTSTEVGTTMGKKIGQLAVKTYMNTQSK
jgi:hypothetical protein